LEGGAECAGAGSRTTGGQQHEAAWSMIQPCHTCGPRRPVPDGVDEDSRPPRPLRPFGVAGCAHTYDLDGRDTAYRPGPLGYTIFNMGEWGIEVEPEVRLWLEALSDAHYARVENVVDRLAERPTTLGEPLSRHLGGKLRELRFTLDRNQMRVTYWLAPHRRIVLLTVFRKTKMRETEEVERARIVQAECEEKHAPATHVYVRQEGP
jgi:hypothetical protein